MATAQEIGEKLMVVGAWGSNGDVNSKLDRTANCIREVAREVLRVLRDNSGKHRGDLWWNGEVQEIVKSKKTTYVKLVESKDEEDKRMERDIYNMAKK